MSIFAVVALAILAIIAFLFLCTCVVITPENNVRMIETFGRFSATRRAGLSLKAPWPFQTASDPFSLAIHELSVEVGVKSSDNAFVEVPIRVQFLVDARKAKEAFYVLANPSGQIKSFVVNEVRTTASGMTFDELFTSKDRFQKDVQDTLTEEMSGFGYIVRNVLVDDPQPSEELRKAFDRVLASQRLKEAAKNEGEAARELLVANAKAEKEAMELRGEAIAAFRKTITEGNAEAIKSFTEGTNLPASAALDFITATNEMEAVTRAAEAGGRIVFISAAARTAGAAPVLATLGDQGHNAPAAPVARPVRKAPASAAPKPAAVAAG